MSMLTAQCENLRIMARLVRDYDYREISRALREAADTIENLRNRMTESQTCHDLGTFSSWGMFTCSNCDSLITLNAIHIADRNIGSTPLHYCPNCGQRIVE